MTGTVLFVTLWVKRMQTGFSVDWWAGEPGFGTLQWQMHCFLWPCICYPCLSQPSQHGFCCNLCWDVTTMDRRGYVATFRWHSNIVMYQFISELNNMSTHIVGEWPENMFLLKIQLHLYIDLNWFICQNSMFIVWNLSCPVEWMCFLIGDRCLKL